METTLTTDNLVELIASSFQSKAQPGETILVEDLNFHFDGNVVPVGRVSFWVKTSPAKKGRPPGRKPKPETSIPRHEILLRKVTFFNLPVTVQNFLERAKVLYVWQLAVLSDGALLQVGGIGKVSLRTIRMSLMEMPDYEEGTEMSLRNRFFRRIFSIRSLEVKNPRSELAMIVLLEKERLAEVESFIRSTIAV